MKVIITGATGYIGNRVLAKARLRGWQAVAATRSPPSGDDTSWIPYGLDDELVGNWPNDSDILHLAADTSSDIVDIDVEVRAVQRLMKVVRRNGGRLLFLSSQGAAQNAESPYGQAKWHIERVLLEDNGVIIRAGLVYGGARRGLFGTLVRLVDRFPALPAFTPPPIVQPIHVDDLAEAICRIVELGDVGVREWHLGAKAPISFTTFLRAIAKHRSRRWCVFVPIPTILVAAAARLVSRRVGRLGYLRRLHSLIRTKAMATTPSLAQLGMTLRPLADGMQPSGLGRRRKLAREGHTLIRYVLGAVPPSACVRRYIRAIEGLRDGKPLCLPPLLERWPACIGLIEVRNNESNRFSEFRWRIDAATQIAEASTAGAQHFLLLGERSKVRTTCSVVRAICVELGLRLLRPVVGRLFRNATVTARDL